MNPQVKAFFDETTWTVSYAVYDQPAQTAAFPADDLPLSYGGAGLRPEGVPVWEKPYSPVMVYRWEATRDAVWNLSKVSDGTPFDGADLLLTWAQGPRASRRTAARRALSRAQRT